MGLDLFNLFKAYSGQTAIPAVSFEVFYFCEFLRDGAADPG